MKIRKKLIVRVLRKVKLPEPIEKFGATRTWDWKTIPVEVDLLIEIDEDALANHLGQKAAANKNGKTIMQDGLIVGTALSRRDLPTE